MATNHPYREPPRGPRAHREARSRASFEVLVALVALFSIALVRLITGGGHSPVARLETVLAALVVTLVPVAAAREASAIYSARRR